MADQVIGTARIDITADPSGVEAATARAKSSISSMSKDAQAQYQQLSAAEKRRVDALVRQADTVGMTRAQQIAYNASLKTSGPLLDELTKRLQANETAAKKAGISFNQYGLSAKQELAALRQTPAQITDIITSLQGGQKPLTVLLQQGGQLRDVFGGIVPAAKALGGAVVGMINPVTLTAGGLAAIAYGAYQSATEMDGLNRTLIMSGNAMGVTTGQASDMATNMSKMADVTRSGAITALTDVAKSGKIAGDQMEEVASIVAQSVQLLGRDAKDVVAEFAKIADDPVKGVEELNRQYHFLTGVTDEQIRLLVEQGRTQDAVRLGTETFANVTQQRLSEVRNSLNVLQRGWDDVKLAASNAWAAMFSVANPQTLQGQIDMVNAQIDKAMKLVNGQIAGASAATKKAAENALPGLQAKLAGLMSQVAGANATASATAQNDAAVRLVKERADFLKGGRTKSQQKDDAVATENQKWKEVSESLKEGSDEYRALYAAHKERLHQIDEKYKDKSGGPKDDAATRLLMSLREQEASLRAQVDSSEKLTSQQSALAKFNQQIADIKTKQTLTAEQKSLLANQDKIRAQYEINIGVEREAEARKSLIALQQTSAQIDQQMASSRELANERYQRLLDTLGLGDKAAQRVQGEAALFKEFRKLQDELTKKAAKGGTLDSDEYKQETEKIQAELQRRLAGQKNYYDTLDEQQKSWLLGAEQGLANYADESNNALKNVGSFATQTFSEMDDALTAFVTTGKLSFADLTDSIIKNMVRISIQQSITGPLAGAMGGFLGNMGIFNGGVSGLSTASAVQQAGGDGIGSLIASNPAWLKSANGNVFSGSGIAAYENMIVNKPTFFASGGNVMGEAGPEAIMPLKRGPDGRLGVSVGGGSGGVSVIINNNTSAQATQRETIDSRGHRRIEVTIGELAGAEARRPGSAMNQSMRAGFGLTPALARR